MLSHVRPAISPRSSSDRLPKGTVTQNLVPIKPASSAHTQPSPPPSERSSPNFYISGTSQKPTSNSTTTKTKNQVSKNQKTNNVSAESAAAPITIEGKDIIVISDDNDSDCELVFDPSSFNTTKSKPQSDNSSNKVNSSQQGVDKSVFTKNDQLLLNSKLKDAQKTQDKLNSSVDSTNLQADQRPIIAHSTGLEKLIEEVTENEILPTISKSKAAQQNQDKFNTSVNESVSQIDQSLSKSHSGLALSKIGLDSNEKESNNSKPKISQKSKNKSAPLLNGTKNKKTSSNVEVKTKRPASDKNSSNSSSKSHDKQSALKKAKTSSKKDLLSQETLKVPAPLVNTSNPFESSTNKNATKEPKSTKMICRKTSIKPSEKKSLISKAIAQSESLNSVIYLA
jgi:hypothetical protein